MENHPGPILIVEDTDALRQVLCSVLEQQGFTVLGVPSAETAVQELAKHPYACILADFKLPGDNGLQLLDQVRQTLPTLPFILMTAYGSIEIAVEAMKHGANDFISKPFDPTVLANVLRQVIEHKQIVDRSGVTRRRALITESEALKKLLAQAERVAGVDTSVLILGESGTGKELLARFVHEHSPRRNEPFVAVNCAALPQDLLESEFFGHEAGSFTGATQTRQGVFEVASQGTIFLDEIGDMRPTLQVKLLRALQEHEIRRVGGSKNIPVSPRVIAATNCDVMEALKLGDLREDFYYRLAVVTFTMPPLRDRPEDVLPIARSLMEFFAGSTGRDTVHLSKEAEAFLMRYPWPGNVRELENVMERAALLGGNEIKIEHLGITPGLDLDMLHDATRTLAEVANEATRRAEVSAITAVLKRTNGNKLQAAEILGVSYKTLLNKVKEYQLKGPG